MALSDQDLERFPEETCAWCGGTFLLRSDQQKYCRRSCTVAAKEDRARKRKLARLAAELRCVDCSGPIPNPTRKNFKRCLACNDRHWRAYRIEYCRRWRVERTHRL